MGQKVPGTPRKYRPSLKNSPLKFQKKTAPGKNTTSKFSSPP